MIDVRKWNLHGPVRSVRSEIAEWDAEQHAWKDRRVFRYVVFDAGGRIAQLDQRGPHEAIYRTQHAYDEQGRPASETSGTAGERVTFRRRWTYDERGRETSIVVAHGEGTEEIWQASTYDDRGLRTDRVMFPAAQHNTAYGVKGSEFCYAAPGAVNQLTRYDESGEAVDVEFFDPEGTVVRRVRMTRDPHGRVLVEEAQTPSPIQLDRQPGMSDAQFEAMRHILTSAAGSMQTTYEYDADGRPLTRVRKTGQLGETRTAYRYDERGNPIEESEVRVERGMSVHEDGVPHMEADTRRVHDVRFAYVYDGGANWTEKVVSARYAADDEFRPTNAEWRTIDYFE